MKSFLTSTQKEERGMSLVEILIGSAIITVGILAVINAYTIFVKYALLHDKTVQARYLLEEGIETMTLFRDESWSTYIAPLTASSTYHLVWSGTSWTFGTSTEYIDGVFERSVVVQNVNRDTTTHKISTTGNPDANTRKVTVTVAYPVSTGTTTKSLSKYLSNVYNN